MSEYHPGHWKVNFISNVLLLMLLLAIVVNSLLILGVQIWFVYDLDSPQEALDLYSGYSLLDFRKDGQMQTWLLSSPTGDKVLLTVEKHSFIEQYRIVGNRAKPVAEDDSPVRFWGDSGLVYITVDGQSIEQYNLTKLAIPLLKNLPEIPMPFVLYGVLLIILEGIFYSLFQRVRGVQ